MSFATGLIPADILAEAMERQRTAALDMHLRKEFAAEYGDQPNPPHKANHKTNIKARVHDKGCRACQALDAQVLLQQKFGLSPVTVDHPDDRYLLRTYRNVDAFMDGAE